MNMKLNVRTIIQSVLLAAFIAGAMAGCAVLEEPETPKAIVATPAPSKKIPPRELGSLWSEDSMWNHVYTATSARVVGDIITIHLDEKFKTRVLAYRDPVESEEKTKQPERAVASESAEGKKTNLMVRGTIEEVGPRGVYRVAAANNVELDGWEPFIVVKGRVRDRDISTNDEVQITDIVDLSFDVLKAPPVQGGSQGAGDVSW